MQIETLGELTLSLVQDLRDLRSGKINNTDARTRAMVAREVLRAVHYHLEGVRMIDARPKGIESGQGH